MENWEQIICIISHYRIKLSKHRKRNFLTSILILRKKRKKSKMKIKIKLWVGTYSSE